MDIETNSLKKSLLKNSFWSFLSAAISRLGALIFTIILARFLMPEGYGIYSIVLSTAMIFLTFADLGINQAFVRYISDALVRDKKKIPSYYRYFLKIKFRLALAASLLLIILSYPLAFYLFKNQTMFLPLLVSAFYIFVLTFDTFYSQLFYSIERVSYLSIKETINQILRILFALVVFYIAASAYQVTGIFVSFILVSIILIIFSLIYLKKLIPELYLKEEVEIDKSRIKKFIGYLTIASLSSVFFSYIDSIMLGIFVAPEYVGYYRVAFSLVFGIAGLLGFPLAIILPIFTKLKEDKTKKVFDKIVLYLAIISIPSLAGLLVLGRYFLVLFFGYAYLDAYLPLIFLSFLIFPIILVNLFIILFSAKEKPQIFAKLILVTSFINIVLNFALITILLKISPLWATAGAGIATLTSWLFYLFASAYFLKKDLNISVSFKPLIKPIIASLIMSAALLFSLSFIKETGMTPLLGVLEIILGTIVYFAALFLIKGIKKEDLSLIKIIFKK